MPGPVLSKMIRARFAPQLDAKQIENQGLLSQVEALQAQLASEGQKLDLERQTLSTTKQELTACRAQLERATSDQRAGASQLAQSNSTIDNLQKEIEQARIMLANSRREGADATESSKTLQSEVYLLFVDTARGPFVVFVSV